MVNGSYDYGLWWMVGINAGIFIGFAVSYLAPSRKREWRSLGVFSAFVVALFTEMYGFPLTIYLLSAYLGRLPFADPFAHKSGNLWASLFVGIRWSWLFMGLGSLLFIVAYILISKGWRAIYEGEGDLVTDGIYASIRHPQYAGLMVAILGMLIQWPTLITFLIAPFLLWSYYRLARKEERELEERFGEAYREYKKRVPAFIPRFPERDRETPAIEVEEGTSSRGESRAMANRGGTAYDAIIVGGSFAGLAVASQLRGKVLLIERNEIGAHQTSACGTLLGVPKRLGLMDTVLQVHHRLLFHTSSRTECFDVSEHPFCTFDYRAFCQRMASAIEAEILRAKVLGLEGEEVVTDVGRFTAPIIIDASGWRAVLASSLRRDFVSREEMSYGIETVAPRRGDGLCFWYDPNLLPKGVAWFFPIGSGSRIGVASYTGDGHLKAHLELFLESQGLHRVAVHGGYFPAGLREPTVGRIFVVGDAAGQCLPLTGEGIRPALYFGQKLGTIVQRIISGEIMLEEGLKEYRAFVARHRGLFHLLGFFQRLILAVPTSVADRLIALTCREPLRFSILRGYVAFADPQALRPLKRKAGVEVPLNPWAGIAR